MFNNPTTDDFKTYFQRDFPFGTESTTVMDSDIMKAFADTLVNFNPCLFANQATYSNGFLNLAAHFLVMNLRASTQGIAGQYDWLTNSKAAGSVNEGLSIPERILANPEFAMLAKTQYGAKYLFLVLPQLAGQIFSSHGRTHA